MGVGSFSQTSHLTRGRDDPEASLVLLHSPGLTVGLDVYRLLCTSARTQGVVESSKHDLGEKTEFYYGLFYVLLWYNSDLITFTKLNYLRVRHVRWESGEWWAGSKPWKGRVNFGTKTWEQTYLQKGSKGVFWSSAQVLHLIARWVPCLDLQESGTCCKRNNCRMKLTKVDKGFHVQIVPPQFLTRHLLQS